MDDGTGCVPPEHGSWRSGDAAGEGTSAPATRQTTVGLFRLLLDFAEHSARPVLDVNGFEEVLWLVDIPQSAGCFARSWGAEENRDPDVWVEVAKAKEPPCPEPPETCRLWLAEPLPFSDEDPPQLSQRILVPPEDAAPGAPTVGEAGTAEEPECLRLEDHAEIDARWARFLEERWAPWAARHRVWRAHQAVYAQLFHMRQTLLREGERFEAVLALGLLDHRRPDGQRIRRHLLTTPVNMEFDPDGGVFTVGPPPGGGRPSLELEMLPEFQRPGPYDLRTMEAAAEALAGDPWDEGALSALLRSFVQTIHDRGEYRAQDTPLPSPPAHPVVTRAPALILRKRTMRSMSACFRRILEQLEGGGELPPAIELLAGAAGRGADASGARAAELPTPIFFPKPANEEQRQIIYRLATGRGVLVQGPPGTGKSHTIANLICHLLAEGQRILVTAQTPRALKVLRDKIPESIRPLCVTALGNDRASLDALQTSVREIIGRRSRWSAEEAERRIRELEEERDQMSSELARLDDELRQLRGDETVTREIAGGAYRGTPQRIAERVREEAERFSWFRDVPENPEAALEISPDELREAVELLRSVSEELRPELSFALPEGGTVPTVEELSALRRDEEEAQRHLERSRSGTTGQATLECLMRVPRELALELARTVEELEVAIVTARRRPLPWVPKAVTEILAGDDTPWVELRRETADLLKGLSEEAHEADRYTVERPEEIGWRQLLADAEDRHKRLSAGARLNWLSKRIDPVLRRTAYVAERVRVDGRLCDNPTVLSRLIVHLRFARRLEVLWRHWGRWSQPGFDRETYTRQVGRLTENLEALDQVLAILDPLNRAKELVHRVPGLPQPAWHDEAAFSAFAEACRARVAQQRLAEIREQLERLEHRLIAHLEHPDAHPIVHELLEAVRARNSDRLIELRRRLQELLDARARLERAEALLKRAARQLPRLVAALRDEPGNPGWEERLADLSAAWRWAGAREWLRRRNEPGRLERIDRESRDLRRRRLEAIEELASLLAWKEFFDRLTPEHHQHLAAWQQAVRRIGKRGKYAARHRRDAQQHLQRCRDAIPAWIMPLHLVYETILPEPGMFDVVIVDEASQCSLDSLSLLYLGKRILIVGDDEQISPTVIRFDHGEFAAIVRRHLGDFPLASVFQPDTSLFDLGQVWFGDRRIQLREHFRCVPEIIRFSNHLCYDGSLVPLRQYPPDRLEPVVARYVPDGFQRGSSSNAINEPEAEALVEAVAACCADPRYEGRTMGVICLLGSAQARLIEQKLLARLDSDEIEARRLLCGNAYSFQGDERDVIFLSLVTAAVDENGAPVPFRALTDKQAKQRFNVAASRARDQLWLFHSINLDDTRNPDDLRRRLLQHFLDPGLTRSAPLGPDIAQLERLAASPRQRCQAPPEPFESWFEVDVFLRIVGRGYRVRPQFPIAGYRIDLVVEGGQRRLAVECDGDTWHGPDRFFADLDRQRQLERAGWTFWRVRGSEFYADPDAALEELWVTLDELGIGPGGTDRPVSGTVQVPSASAAGSTTAKTSPPEWSSDGDDGEAAPAEGTTALDPWRRAEPAAAQQGSSTGTTDRGGTPAPSPTGPPTPGGGMRPVPAAAAAPTGGQRGEEDLSPQARRLGMVPYTPYDGGLLPDPHTATPREVRDGLMAVVQAEGPILGGRLLRAYAQAAGFRRTGRQIRSILNRQLQRAVREGALVKEYQAVDERTQVPVYRTPTQPRAPLRSAGPRHLQEIPPAEIIALMRALRGDHANRPVQDREAFVRLVLGLYGFRRLTSGARSYLEGVLRVAEALET